jgi:mitochondrial fission protein ELM1
VFLGSEPGQFRAERVFVYSIEKHRDPSRVYEVYLMKDLVGFDRRGWTTGFTNYRFAIPHLAGRTGRAIFNDVDEAYYGDPADLFDAEMGTHGYLATSDTETSVMLIDCERMASIWDLETVQNKMKKDVLRATLRENPGIRGDLPPEWTARDVEFVPGFSKLQHWTTLQTQPWRPVPSRFVYQPNPTGQLWFDLKDEADTVGYQIFGPTHPSSLYRDRLTRLEAASLSRTRLPADIATEGARQLGKALDESRSKRLLDVHLGGSLARSVSSTVDVIGHDLARSAELGETCDGVACQGVMELLPDEDVPWVVDALFAHARRFVCVAVDNTAHEERLADGSHVSTHSRDMSWWMELFSSASRRHPDVRWSLAIAEPDADGRRHVFVRDGGCTPGEAPRVWVLCDGQRENTGQALALANALGWPFQRKDLSFRGFGTKRKLVGEYRSKYLKAPWPDIVIAAGEACAEQACWIRDQDKGRTRIVEVGRRGGEVADRFDVVVTPAYARLWPHPNRVETAAPLALDLEARRGVGGAEGANIFGDAPRPHVALLVDIPCGETLSIEGLERMAASVGDYAAKAGGTVIAVVGQGLSKRRHRDALRRGLGKNGSLRIVPSAAGEEAFSGPLAAADVVVVAGNDETLVAEAAASAKSVYVYPIDARDSAATRILRTWVHDRANSRPLNARGTARPQQGIEYLCARLIERGYVNPPLDRRAFHEELYRRGIVRPFDSASGDRPGPGKGLREADEIAERVRSLLGYPSRPGATSEAKTA